MIDTNKYEGHTEGPWHWSYFCLYNAIGKEIVQVLGEPCTVELVGEDWDDDTPTQQLMADAPLLLQEVKRLRRIAKNCLEAIEAGGDIRSGTIELIEENLKGMIE